VDMSTPLLPQVVPEIDANPVSFYSGGEGWRSVTGLQFVLIIPPPTRSSGRGYSVLLQKFLSLFFLSPKDLQDGSTDREPF